MTTDPYSRWWTRSGHKPGRFRYFDNHGERITDAVIVARLNALRIPPAWTEVRIAPSQRSKIQAVGRDVKGRRQYIYGAKWTAKRSEAKYAKLIRFAEALPRFRAVTSEHLAQAEPTREAVLALMTRLIDTACFRIGGENYCRENGSYGIATLCNRHMKVDKSGLQFAFRGKRGVQHKKVISEPDLVERARAIAALPGKRLFQYKRDDGTTVPVTGRDVNAYIKQVMGPEFSAKDFRTWNATLRAAQFLGEQGPAETKTAAVKAVRECIKSVSSHLGNTPAICRASYVSPRILSLYEQGLTLQDFRPQKRKLVKLFQAGHTPEEVALMAMLSEEAKAPVKVALPLAG